jgi:hypothetical protein
MKFELQKTARGLSDDDFLEDLRRVARELGRDTVTISEYTEHGLGRATIIQRRFRSWFKALEDAGLKPSRSRISAEQPPALCGAFLSRRLHPQSARKAGAHARLPLQVKGALHSGRL